LGFFEERKRFEKANYCAKCEGYGDYVEAPRK
jgi:hypothetical protein